MDSMPQGINQTILERCTMCGGALPYHHGGCPQYGGVATAVPDKRGHRTFETGATRDTDEGKIDYEGFLSPAVLKRYGEYMHKNRVQSDGSLRASDNWQKGIPIDAYMKSMWRHFIAVWAGYRSGKISEDDLAALMFNVMGMLHEVLK